MNSNRIFWRPSSTPSLPLPLSVRSTGYYMLDDEWPAMKRPKPVVSLIWTVSGKGQMTIKNKRYFLLPDQVAFYLPGETYQMKAASKTWHVRWMAMDGEFPAEFLKALQLKRFPQTVGHCPGFLFDILSTATQEPDQKSEMYASLIAYHILLTAAGMSREKNSEDSLAEKIKNKLEEEIGNSQFGVEQLSQNFSLHRSTICKLFSTHFKTTPSEYQKKLRIRRALSMLGESRLSIADIAHQCGFQSTNYFSRVIKHTVGSTPSMIREEL